MMKNLKALRRIRAARELLRDAEAAKVADAERIRLERDRMQFAADAAVGRIQDEAATRLLEARGIRDLEMVAMDVTAAQVAARGARSQAITAKVDADQATGRLRAKERELRTADKLVTQRRTEL